MKQPAVRCKCGIVHSLDHIGPEDQGRQVVCESCGRPYTVVEGTVPGTVFIRDPKTKELLPVVREAVKS